MKYCANCGTPQADEFLFCQNCGGKLPEAPIPTVNPAMNPTVNTAAQATQATIYQVNQQAAKENKLNLDKVLDFTNIIVLIILISAGISILAGLIWGFSVIEWDGLLGIGIFLGGVVTAAYIVGFALIVQLLYKLYLQNKELIEMNKEKAEPKEE